MKISSTKISSSDLLMRNRLYYQVKPYLPWRLRMGMRRIVARRTREVCKDIWPINEAAGHLPEGWNGWPDGKKFALVLTHDVESFSGLVKCVEVMELEHEFGFRSSFNFIPEGDYKVPRQLREELLRNGFEIGVHDLRHDGKLYWRADEFSENARSINRYLKDWNASGFRSAFMLRNRDCLRELNIQYDASTFDTDPFEPQPDGANTIFPFWISDGDGSGYVELPYTLPQDSTLFLVLDEKSPEIWIRKLKWIVARGGMVLLNVHPDYLGFDEKCELAEYPAAHYREFLQFVKTNYDGQYWNALPKEVASWFKEHHSARTPAEYVAERVQISRQPQKDRNGFWPAIGFEISRIAQKGITGLRNKLSKFDSMEFAVRILDFGIRTWLNFKQSCLKSAVTGRHGLNKSRKFGKKLWHIHLPAWFNISKSFSKNACRKTQRWADKTWRQAVWIFFFKIIPAASKTNRVLTNVSKTIWDKSRSTIEKNSTTIVSLTHDFGRIIGDFMKSKSFRGFAGRTATTRESVESKLIFLDAAKENFRPAITDERNSHPVLQNANVAVVLYSYYTSDPRPRREAEALKNCGANVDVICLRKESESAFEERNGVHIFRVSLKRRRGGKLTYILQYGWFLTAVFARLTAWSFKKRYRFVHIHNMPDFLVFSALIPKWRGAKIILDLHDPMPELFRTIYNLPDKHFVVRWLKRVEKWSIGFAHQVLTPNAAFKELFVSRSCHSGKIQTIMNSPETAIFNPAKYPARKFNGEKPFTLMYHGLLVERHGLDVAIRAVMRLRRRIPNIKLNMYGERTDYLEKIMEHVWRTSLDRHVEYHGYLPLSEIAENIMNIDLGVIPNRLSAFTEINFPTRIFEYLAMNKPVIVPSTLGIRDYFNDDEILYFEPGNPDDLAKKIEWAWANPEELSRMKEAGLRVYQRNCWDLEREKFVGIVSALVQPEMARAEAVEAKKSFA